MHRGSNQTAWRAGVSDLAAAATDLKNTFFARRIFFQERQKVLQRPDRVDRCPAVMRNIERHIPMKFSALKRVGHAVGPTHTARATPKTFQVLVSGSRSKSGNTPNRSEANPADSRKSFSSTGKKYRTTWVSSVWSPERPSSIFHSR